MADRLPRSRNPPVGGPPPAGSTYAFRALRQRLERDGWFHVHPAKEALKVLPWAVSFCAGAVLARVSGLVPALGAVLCLAVSNTLAGWLAHDFIHARNAFADVVCALLNS